MLTNFHGKPVVWILAGPNGSGKTTFYEQFLARRLGTYVNPDLMASEMNPADPGSVAWKAARAADERRTALLRTGSSFVTETVFSHESKLAFIAEAKAAGFYTRVIFLCLEDPSLNVARVAQRVDRGGHDVPVERIAPRYERAVRNAVLARSLGDELWLYDNSISGRRPRQVARYVAGELVSVRPPVPEWLRRAFGAEIDAWTRLR